MDPLKVPASKGDVGKRQLYHNDCGGEVKRGYAIEADWVCSKCKRSWKWDRLYKFTDQELADRYHTRPPLEDNGEVLVWVKSGKKKHLSALPRWALPEDAERFKL